MTTQTIRTRTSPLLIWSLAMLCVGASVPRAFATPADSEAGYSIKVRYYDLNLASPSGVEVLYRRLDKAARRVCDMNDDPVLHLIHRSQWRLCYQTAFGNAVRDVNNQKLTAMYEQKNKSSSPG